jgi:hypothetical protein
MSVNIDARSVNRSSAGRDARYGGTDFACKMLVVCGGSPRRSSIHERETIVGETASMPKSSNLTSP